MCVDAFTLCILYLLIARLGAVLCAVVDLLCKGVFREQGNVIIVRTESCGIDRDKYTEWRTSHTD